MDNQQAPQPHSVADCRQQLIQTLALIIERERQWLQTLEGHAEAIGKPLMDYMSDHISILNDTVVALASDKYKSIASTSLEVADSAKEAIACFIEFSMASHVNACTSINNMLVTKGITAINLQPVNLP